MKEIVKLENIAVNQYAKNWEEAIHISGDLLVNCGSITDKYVKNMIDSVYNLGPYMVIMPRLALAHAAPCKEVINSDISIVTFKNEVFFNSENDPVKIVICLACIDKKAHIGRLKQIAEKLMEDNIIDKICSCANVEELYELING